VPPAQYERYGFDKRSVKKQFENRFSWLRVFDVKEVIEIDND